ncbi:hypothetical protein [Janthinobacterium sp. J1-1]|uniref:hypothetical protein n=1 Tax=Janthinobacterium sp. J1-1 TaxID=3065910 RepID=UPI002811A09A|nr:hypothetical protein [Janthinobacterium sp. J1-1]
MAEYGLDGLAMASWILENSGLLMLVVFSAGSVARYIDYRHLRDDRYHRGDVGYFWRLMKARDRDGLIVVIMSAIVLCAGLPIVFALLYRIATR